MQQSTNSSNRKKFLWWGAAVLASVTAFKFFNKPKVPRKPVVKMLTQDGRLVEINKELLSAGKKISNEELQQWVKK